MGSEGDDSAGGKIEAWKQGAKQTSTSLLPTEGRGAGRGRWREGGLGGGVACREIAGSEV